MKALWGMLSASRQPRLFKLRRLGRDALSVFLVKPLRLADVSWIYLG